MKFLLSLNPSRLIFWTLTLVLTTSCSSVSSSEKEQTTPEVLESIYGVTLNDGDLLFKVKSNGCTKVDDFQFVFKETEGTTELSAIRTKKDHCRRKPHVIELSKSLDYLSLEPNLPLRLINPLEMNR